MLNKLFRPRTIALMILLFALAALTYGFAAGLGVTANNTLGAGQNTTALSDLAVTVYWELESDLSDGVGDEDPSTGPTAQLEFGADAPSVVWARLGDDTAVTVWTAWVSCTVPGTGAYEATCNFPDSVDLEDVYFIEIAAAE